MKIYSKILGITLGAMTIGMASCSNEINDGDITAPVQNKSSVLVKAPQLKAWSGEQDLSKAGSTRAGETVALEAVTSDEIAAAKAYFNATDNYSPGDGKPLTIEDLKGWKAYYVQDIADSNRLPNEIAQFVGSNVATISNIAFWDLDPDEVVKLLKTDAYTTHDAKVVYKYDGQLIENPILDISFETTGYEFSGDLVEGARSSGHNGMYDFAPNYKIAQIGDNNDVVYIALYGYYTKEGNNGYWNHIIKLTKTEVAPEGPEAGEGGGNDGDVTEIDKILHNNEVEVNLSIEDVHALYDVEDLITKLSIHVRHAGDVKVRIPVPVETLVPADDLAIVLQHKELLEQYGDKHRASFDINGNTVELTVAFTEATDCAGNGFGYYIEVTTKGINKDVIEFCQSNYGDGVNFEVMNYYQWNKIDENGEATRRQPTTAEIEELRDNWLNKTTIEFGYDNGQWNAYTSMSDYPYYFINAFNNLTDGVNVMDCQVKVITNQNYAYENSYEGEHLNGSPYNIIYVRDDIYGTDRQDDAHTAK